jgi:hypothetical protein
MKIKFPTEKPHRPKPPTSISRFNTISVYLTQISFKEYVDYLRKNKFSDDYIRGKLGRFLQNYRTDIDNVGCYSLYNIFTFVELTLQDVIAIKGICPEDIILNNTSNMSGITKLEVPDYHMKIKLFEVAMEQHEKDVKNYNEQLALWEANKKEFELKILNLEKSLNKE